LKYNKGENRMKQLWIGKRFLKELRVCTLIDLKTMEIRGFVATEEEAQNEAAKEGVTARLTEDYDEEKGK